MVAMIDSLEFYGPYRQMVNRERLQWSSHGNSIIPQFDSMNSANLPLKIKNCSIFSNRSLKQHKSSERLVLFPILINWL